MIHVYIYFLITNLVNNFTHAHLIPHYQMKRAKFNICF